MVIPSTSAAIGIRPVPLPPLNQCSHCGIEKPPKVCGPHWWPGRPWIKFCCNACFRLLNTDPGLIKLARKIKRPKHSC